MEVPARFIWGRIDDVVLPCPLEADELRPMGPHETESRGKGFGPKSTHFDDYSARALIIDAIVANRSDLRSALGSPGARGEAPRVEPR